MARAGCNDWHYTRAALFGRASQAAAPPPGGGEEPRGGASRREFLLRSGLAGLTVYAGSAISWRGLWQPGVAAAAGAPSEPVIVSVFLSGGNDGLNTLVPIAGRDHSTYVARRPHLALDPAKCLPLRGPAAEASFAWHPAATGLRDLYDAGKLAVMPAVDYRPSEMSHFHSQKYWQAGAIDPRPANGWMGRWLDRHGTTDNPLQGLTLGGALDPMLKTSGAVPVAALMNPSGAQFSVGGARDQAAVSAALAGLAARPGVNEAMAAANQSLSAALGVAREVGSLGTVTLPPPGLGYAASTFDTRMATLAWMIRAGVGTRLACVAYDDGFDFHDGQAPRQAANLAGLGRTLAAFQADLEANGVADRVVTLVWSEFGRRVEDNDSGGGGTDHGAGGLAMMMGTRVKPGIRTEFPGIGAHDLDANGNLKVVVDFRQIYATLLGLWMGTDPAEVIADAGCFAPVGILA